VQKGSAVGELCKRRVRVVVRSSMTVHKPMTLEKAGAVVGAGLAAGAVFCARKHEVFVATFASAFTFAVVWLVLRWVLLARTYERTLQEADKLLDVDGQIDDVLGIGLHFKRIESDKPENSGSGAVMFHGFGASLFSFRYVMKPLADVLGGPVFAMDHPGFGLTERPRDGFSKYSTYFGAKLGLALASDQGVDRLVLCGHSLGAWVAAQAAVLQPERVRALIFISPAVPPSTKSLDKVFQSPAFAILSKISKALWQLMLVSSWNLFLPLLLSLLRATVTVVEYWKTALQFAVFDRESVTDDLVRGYSLPNQIKDWDRGLLRFVFSQLGANSSEEKPSTKSVYSNIDELKIPCLVVHGEKDRIVPREVGKRVAESISSARYVVVPSCGHIPHEEVPDEVMKIINEFLSELKD